MEDDQEPSCDCGTGVKGCVGVSCGFKKSKNSKNLIVCHVSLEGMAGVSVGVAGGCVFKFFSKISKSQKLTLYVRCLIDRLCDLCVSISNILKIQKFEKCIAWQQLEARSCLSLYLNLQSASVLVLILAKIIFLYLKKFGIYKINTWLHIRI